LGQPTTRLSQAVTRGFDAERWAANSIVPAPDVVGLHSGDPCFPTPPQIIEAAHSAALGGYTGYPPPLGDAELRTALAEMMSTSSGREFRPSNVLITVGASEAIHCAMAALLDPGDEVLLFNPTYSLYAPIARQLGAVPVFVDLGKDFRLDVDRLRSAVTPRTRLIALNNPANPTGVVFTKKELEDIADVAQRESLVVVADEVYDHIVFGDKFTSTTQLEGLVDRLVYVNSFSKTYAMTGWRLGWLAAPEAILRGCEIAHRNCVTGVHWPTQRAGLAAIRSHEDIVPAMFEGYSVRQRLMTERLKGTPGLDILPPQGTFFLFAGFHLKQAFTSSKLAAHLLENGVAVRSGSEYGSAGEGYLRLCYSVELRDIELGAERLHRVFEDLA
jgi:aspartate/methionine/tyrosine aminotransferase